MYIYNDLLFFEASDGVAEVYRTSKHASMSLERHESGWGANWTHLLGGYFVLDLPGSLAQIILYNAVSGTIRTESIVTTNGIGEETLIQELPNWRPGWSQVVAINQLNTGGGIVQGLSQLLFYDAAQGVSEVYSVLGASPWLSLLNRFTGWSKTIKQIVPGSFTSALVPGFFLYDTAGTGEFYLYTYSPNTISLVNKISGLSKTYTLVIPGFFSGGQQTDLLFYDPARFVGDFYAVNNGAIQLLEANTGWHNDWDIIVPGNFSSNSKYTDLLFYSRARHTGQFYRTNHGAIAQLALDMDFRGTWTQILSGNFSPPPGAPITPTPTAQASVLPTLAPFGPDNDYYSLKLTGSGFEANETVSLVLTWVDQNQPAQSLPAMTTPADSSGGFVYTYSGTGGGVCIPFRRWSVVGTGLTSHRQSSSVSVGCP